MSRVEPKDTQKHPERKAEPGRTRIERRGDPHPSQAEGDEHDIGEALQRQEKRS
jgi:hypothetical protein